MPCNHIFHTSCLRSWFQRHQTCPTCRLDVLRPTPTTQNTPGPAPVTPTLGRRAPDTPSTDAAASSSTTDNVHGQSTSNHIPLSPDQAGSSGSSYYNQIPLQYLIRPFTFQQGSTSTDEMNDNSNSDLPEPNSINESFFAFMNAAGQDGGIGPTLFSN